MFNPIFKFSILSQAINFKEKNIKIKINKNINENIDGVNPKIISGKLLLKDLSLGFSK